jgi:adenylate kinase
MSDIILLSPMSYQERYLPKEGENHNRILMLTGISGSGKDFLLSQAGRQSILPNEVKTFNFGDELFNHLKNVYHTLRTRDDIRTELTDEQVRKGILSIVDGVIDSQPIIVNTHVVNKHRGTFAANPDIDKRIRPVGYIFVWSEPGQIATWRKGDTGRARVEETVDEIALHQNLTLDFVTQIASYTRASLVTMWNRTDNLANNLTKLQEIAREL